MAVCDIDGRRRRVENSMCLAKYVWAPIMGETGMGMDWYGANAVGWIVDDHGIGSSHYNLLGCNGRPAKDQAGCKSCSVE